MDANNIALLFPGQGVLELPVSEPPRRAPLSHRSLRRPDALPGPTAQSRSAVAVDVAVYFESLAACARLRDTGTWPAMLIGHGFGEIAALVAGGAFTTAEGVRIVDARAQALSESGTGHLGMAAIEGPRRLVSAFLDLVRVDGISLAVENSSTHSVIVGPRAAMAAAESQARLHNLALVRLKTRQGPHHPSIEGVRARLNAGVGHLRRRSLHTPVFSPLKGRLYRDEDDVIDSLAEQLCQPIRFADAVTHLARAGITALVECAPLRGLASMLDCDTISDTEYRRAHASASVGSSRLRTGLRADACEVA